MSATHARLPPFLKLASKGETPSFSLTVRIALSVLALLALPAAARALGLWGDARMSTGVLSGAVAPSSGGALDAEVARTLAELSESVDLLTRHTKGMSEQMSASFASLRAQVDVLDGRTEEALNAAHAVATRLEAAAKAGARQAQAGGPAEGAVRGQPAQPRAAPPAKAPPAHDAKPAAAGGALVDLSTTESRVFSQNGEDGVLAAIFGAVGTDSKFYVEFGTESGSETNSRVLREHKGWTGLLLDGGNENPAINLHQHFIDAENIGSLLAKYDVPRELDLLSVDVDRNDWYILRNLVVPTRRGEPSSALYRPRVIVVEYNSDWPPPQDKVVAYDAAARWDGTNYFG